MSARPSPLKSCATTEIGPVLPGLKNGDPTDGLNAPRLSATRTERLSLSRLATTTSALLSAAKSAVATEAGCVPPAGYVVLRAEPKPACAGAAPASSTEALVAIASLITRVCILAVIPPPPKCQSCQDESLYAPVEAR